MKDANPDPGDQKIRNITGSCTVVKIELEEQKNDLFQFYFQK